MRHAIVGASVRAIPRYRRGPIILPSRNLGRAISLPAPTGGWDAVSSLADMPEDRAITLDNWFPRPDSIEVRRGRQIHCGGMGSSAVDSLMPYHGVSSVTSKLFAAADGKFYDVTTAGAPAVTTETGLSNNRWQYTNFTTSAAKFLWVCNGVDAPRHFNGSVWAQPSITGISATDIIHVTAHQKRLWFTLAQSTKAAYLGTGAVAGAATEFELGSLFTRGGVLQAIGTWTRDGGDGPDDVAVFISSRGQCAVYAGTDPSADATWALVGVYNLGAPIGRRCFTKVAGDIALINVDGVLPLSLALTTDRGAAARISITKNIENAMNAAARSYASNFGWSLTPYAKGTMVLLNVPIAEGSNQHQYVMNTLTGAWCRFTGWDGNCLEVFNDRLFIGGNAGQVFEADIGDLDQGSQIDARGQTAYNYYKSRGIMKDFKLCRALVTTDSSVRPAVGMSTDFKDNAVVGTPSAAAADVARYDSAVYDTDVYAVETLAVTDWLTIANQGHAGSIHFRGLTGDTTKVSLWGTAKWGIGLWSGSTTSTTMLRINGFDVIYGMGGFM